MPADYKILTREMLSLEGNQYMACPYCQSVHRIPTPERNLGAQNMGNALTHIYTVTCINCGRQFHIAYEVKMFHRRVLYDEAAAAPDVTSQAGIIIPVEDDGGYINTVAGAS